ncbi:DUF2783 domain-containing protein [Acidovorax sp. Root70]|uniref:DUF2783 domain-containing protein n=1 Tax=Acidovorax sp. Root70 TaxID=1736590 RepID=UPI0006FBD67D|nr:DUF2783 domain-containing protein [Acidovorax sp. Root70]KRB26644.1 hypothetical protein ASD94_14240 [Acidovorax sp. Root70]
MLNTQPNLQACDDFYEALIAAHQGLSTPESHAMNARLVLLLANHISDQATLQHALQLARGSAVPMADRRTTPAVTPVVPTHAVAA